MSALPHGDPCPRCAASSTATDARDRVCGCKPCPTCKRLNGNLCAYCEESLGCSKHEVNIKEHVAEACTASVARRREVDDAVAAGLDLPLLNAVGR